MKITLVIGGDVAAKRATRIECKQPYAGAAHVVLAGPCPNCKAEVCKLRGRDQWHGHDTYHATATALCCDIVVGKLEVKVSTIFGIEEDRRVLLGRVRVY